MLNRLCELFVGVACLVAIILPLIMAYAHYNQMKQINACIDVGTYGTPACIIK